MRSLHGGLVTEERGSRAKEHAQGLLPELTEAGDAKGAQTWRLLLDRIGKRHAEPREPYEKTRPAA